METVTLFTWGYWGWGTSTPQLVQAVDAVEAGRGFQPPLFVDIRFSRSVRAPGFRDGAFAELLGKDRYIWMNGLGNRGIQTGTLEIADPAAAEELLDLAIRSAESRRRLLFFCACEFPRWDGKLNCHRDMVADLVLEQVRRHGRSAEIVEWPGGAATAAELKVRPEMLQAVRRGRKTVLLGTQLQPQFAGLPWGSIVTLRAGRDSAPVISGPAQFKDGWVLPVLICGEPGRDPSALKRDAQQLRQFLGLEARAV